MLRNTPVSVLTMPDVENDDEDRELDGNEEGMDGGQGVELGGGAANNVEQQFDDSRAPPSYHPTAKRKSMSWWKAAASWSGEYVDHIAWAMIPKYMDADGCIHISVSSGI